jgi:hypothetical protein
MARTLASVKGGQYSPTIQTIDDMERGIPSDDLKNPQDIWRSLALDFSAEKLVTGSLSLLHMIVFPIIRDGQAFKSNRAFLIPAQII